MLPKRLVLSGGGSRIICHAGALKALEEAKMLRCIREYVGTSAGAITALALAIGFSIKELTEKLLTFDFSELQDPNAFDVDNVMNFLELNGLDNGDTMLAYFSNILEQRGFSPKLTFSQLLKLRGVTLRVLATDVRSAQPFEFSPSKTPNTSIIEGMLASVAIPFYFTPRVAPAAQEGWLAERRRKNYVAEPTTQEGWLADGGLLFHYPLPYLSEAEQKEAIGICLCTNHEQIHHPSTDESWLFFKRVIQFILQPPMLPHDRLMPNTVYIEMAPSFIMNLALGPAEKQALLESAYKQTQQSLRVKVEESRSWLRTPAARRHSI